MKIQKTLHLLILTVLLTTGLIIVGCQKDTEPYVFPDPSTLPPGLKGTWLETTLRIDTIIFYNSEYTGLLYLKNNFNNMNFIGIYEYQILGDSIKISDPTSSSSEIAYGLNFYFNFDEPNLTLTVANFTGRLSVKNPTLIFRKIK
ncbi:MAG: hypothetical protein WCS03_12080 [Bacteroidota bacterium]